MQQQKTNWGPDSFFPPLRTASQSIISQADEDEPSFLGKEQIVHFISSHPFFVISYFLTPLLCYQHMPTTLYIHSNTLFSILAGNLLFPLPVGLKKMRGSIWVCFYYTPSCENVSLGNSPLRQRLIIIWIQKIESKS